MDFWTWFAVKGLRDDLSNERAIRSAHRRMEVGARARVARLEDELGRVSLLAFALSELCLAKGVITTDELRERMRAIDVADGVEDGRRSSPAPKARSAPRRRPRPR